MSMLFFRKLNNTGKNWWRKSLSLHLKFRRWGSETYKNICVLINWLFLSLSNPGVNYPLAIGMWCSFGIAFTSDSNYPERNISLSFCLPFLLCIDINECQTLVPSPCSCGVPGEACGATCINTASSYFCTCANGFQLRSGGAICDGNLLGIERGCFRLGNP